MRNHLLFRLSLLTVAIVLSGCSSNNLPSPSQYSGFLQDYSQLKPAKSASGIPVLRWTAPGFNPDNYSNIVYQPITYYPTPAPNTQLGQDALNTILDNTNSKFRAAVGTHYQIVQQPGPRTLIFKGAITAVKAKDEGLQFYEVLPITMVVAGAEAASGHRTMDTRLNFEAELIDASTNQPVFKVVRTGSGNQLANDKQQITAADVKRVIDNMANDAAALFPQKSSL